MFCYSRRNLHNVNVAILAQSETRTPSGLLCAVYPIIVRRIVVVPGENPKKTLRTLQSVWRREFFCHSCTLTKLFSYVYLVLLAPTRFGHSCGYLQGVPQCKYQENKRNHIKCVIKFSKILSIINAA